jgi:dTDP-glucose 4,6-dehydratase
VKEILGILNLPEKLIEFVEDRPGHDVRYSINPNKIEEKLGWKPKHNFNDALKFTVEHYVKNVGKYRAIYSR